MSAEGEFMEKKEEQFQTKIFAVKTTTGQERNVARLLAGEVDVVETTGGPFKGMRAKITRIDKSKGEVTLELLEATFTLPITVHSDYVKLVERAKTGSSE